MSGLTYVLQALRADGSSAPHAYEEVLTGFFASEELGVHAATADSMKVVWIGLTTRGF